LQIVSVKVLDKPDLVVYRVCWDCLNVLVAKYLDSVYCVVRYTSYNNITPDIARQLVEYVKNDPKDGVISFTTHPHYNKLSTALLFLEEFLAGRSHELILLKYLQGEIPVVVTSAESMHVNPEVYYRIEGGAVGYQVFY
jgi:hypothetical protein